MKHAKLAHLGLLVPAANWHRVLLLRYIDEPEAAQIVGQPIDYIEVPVENFGKGTTNTLKDRVEGMCIVSRTIKRVDTRVRIMTLEPASWGKITAPY